MVVHQRKFLEYDTIGKFVRNQPEEFERLKKKSKERFLNSLKKKWKLLMNKQGTVKIGDETKVMYLKDFFDMINNMVNEDKLFQMFFKPVRGYSDRREFLIQMWDLDNNMYEFRID